MNTITRLLNTFALCGIMTAALGLIGCGEHHHPREVPEQGSITSMGIDIQNFNNAAKELTNQMLSAPRMQQELARAPRGAAGELPLVLISYIKNDSGLKINMVDYLVTPIEEVLVNSGTIDSVSEDKKGKDLSAANAILGRAGEPRIPHFVMHGTVSRLTTRNDDTRQNAYVFHMRVTRTNDNSVIFVGSKQIYKQADRRNWGL